MPEIKDVQGTWFQNCPTPYFEEVALGDDANQSRVYNRLVELGVLTPEEGIIALETGRLPDNDESLESQRKFKDFRDQGLYQPIMKKKVLAVVKLADLLEQKAYLKKQKMLVRLGKVNKVKLTLA